MAIIRCKIARVVHWTSLPGAMRSCKCGHRVVFKSLQRKHKQKRTPPYLFLIQFGLLTSVKLDWDPFLGGMEK